MSTDCFGNQLTQHVPPSIADDFASIERFRTIPVGRRLDYNTARVAAMVGETDGREAWDMYWDMVRELHR